jgi:hypothetical protein
MPSPDAFPLPTPEGPGLVMRRIRALLRPDRAVEFAADLPDDDLLAAEAVPSHLGGGWLFLSLQSVYHAPSFLGPLRRLVTIDTPRVLGFGPTWTWIRGSDQSVFLDRRTFSPTKPADTLPGEVVRVVAGDDRRALLLRESGPLDATLDGGLTWATVRAPEAIREIEADEGALYISTEIDKDFRMGRRLAWLSLGHDGNLRWINRPSDGTILPEVDPLVLAVRGGQHVSADEVLLPLPAHPDGWERWRAARPQVMNVASGKTRTLKLETSGDEPRAAILSGVDGGVFLVDGRVMSRATREPRIERELSTNDPEAAPHESGPDGTVLLRGRCREVRGPDPRDEDSPPAADDGEEIDDGAPSAPEWPREDAAEKGSEKAVCVRRPGGRWHVFSLPTWWKSDLNVTSFALFGDGTVTALGLDEESPVLLELPSARKVVVKRSQVVIPGFGRSRRELAPNHGGQICFWQGVAHGIVLARDGEVTRHDPPFTVARWGKHQASAFAMAADGSAFETDSCGERWVPVSPPPGPWSRAGLAPCTLAKRDPSCELACSEVGCEVPPFLRVGWSGSRTAAHRGGRGTR